MEMMQFKPWETEEVKKLNSLTNESLPILDIQLGGGCNNRCAYCDTTKYGFPCRVNLNQIEKLMDNGHIKWVYVCGLGEPTQCQNIRYLKELLRLCKTKGIKLTTFINLLRLDQELLDYLDNGTLHILFKLDTFQLNRMRHLYGQENISKLKGLYNNYAALKEVTHIENGTTNIGASIVPTSVNYDELDMIISCCINQGFFPFIGQLENAGRGIEVYNELALSNEQLQRIKDHIFQKYGIDYEIPICPATIGGIHITNINKIILDKKTGLSCPWFWLNEPEIELIGDLETMNYDEIVQKILDYRKSKIKDVEDMEKQVELYPFGGCGGNIKRLLRTYLDVFKEKR